LRLSSFSKQDSYTAAEFCEFHFSEEAKKHGAEEIKDPFWDELFFFKKQTDPIPFFTHLPVLVSQPPFEFRHSMRMFCVLWDRAWIPLEFWSGEAAAAYLEVTLGKIDRRGIVPGAGTLRQWQHRLGLVPFRPAVITKYNRNGRIPADGFCLEAFELAGIPAPGVPISVNPEKSL
jgi:hypothetical protein